MGPGLDGKGLVLAAGKLPLFLKNLLFTLLVPGVVAVYVPLRIVRDREPGSGVSFAVGCLGLALGALVYGWCVWEFARFGRGTPAPIDAPKKLVVRGLYRCTRNPMYLGVLTVIFAWALLFHAAAVALYALAVAGAFHTFVVLYEEPHLAARFGSEYDEYRRRVGRWIPGLRPPRSRSDRRGR